MDYKKEFKSFAKSEGVSSSYLHHLDNSIVNVKTPYILEEREMRVTQMDVFSRLLKDNIIWLSGPVDQYMSDIVQAQLLFLDSVKQKDITLYINSPGGSVLAGLAIIDVMNYIKSDIATVNIGMAASMGSVLLSSGTKGKRASLVYSKVMVHQVSSGQSGNLQDTTISHLESHKYNYILFKILSENCGKTFDELFEISRRDKWFNSDESKEFGLVDEVIKPEGVKSITELLNGFDDFYQKEVLSKIKP
jgi:ATP-dependent Clp protease, protease subunit